MQNFEYYNPTKIIFGEGEIAKLSELVPQTSVLILYGEGSIKRNGVYDQVIKALGNRKVFEVSGVKPNPTYEKAMEAVELIRKENIGFILAVGGGSVIDSAKFISLATFYQGEAWDILTNRGLQFEKALPLGAVLTLPATGSEMNCFAVISRGEDKLSFGNPLVFPKFSVLDPQVTFSLNERQVGNGVVDAFVHVMEQYLTYPVNSPVQDRMAEAVLMTLIEEGPKTLKKTNDLESRSNLMWSASIALSSILGVGVPQDWSTHMIGHEITAFYGVDHARTLAIILPAMMWVMRNEKRKKLVQYGERVWKIKAATDEEVITGAIRKTTDFFESMGLPTKFSGYQIKEEVIERVVARFESRGFEGMGENQQVKIPQIREVLKVALQ